MASHNLFIIVWLGSLNYESVMTHKVHLPIWWWIEVIERERERDTENLMSHNLFIISLLRS